MGEPVIISDRFRTPITVECRDGGGVAVRGHFRGILVLSRPELDRLHAFATNKPTIRRYVASNSALSASQPDEMQPPG